MKSLNKQRILKTDDKTLLAAYRYIETMVEKRDLLLHSAPCSYLILSFHFFRIKITQGDDMMDKFTHRFKFELGIVVESDVSGFKGIITDRAENLNGCDRYWIAPKVDNEGKLPDGKWFDEYEIVVIGESKLNRESKKDELPGGPPSSIK